MKSAHLKDMVKGWFVGDFEPTVLRSSACEVAVKHYRAGDIVVIEPGEATAFEALTDAVNVVVKLPSTKDDKYHGEAPD